MKKEKKIIYNLFDKKYKLYILLFALIKRKTRRRKKKKRNKKEKENEIILYCFI